MKKKGRSCTEDGSDADADADAYSDSDSDADADSDSDADAATEGGGGGGGDLTDAEECEAQMVDAFANLGDKVLHFTWGGSSPAIPLDGLGLTTVTDPKQADFILAHGTTAVNGNGAGDAADEQRKEGAVDTPLDAMREMLEEAAALGLPMVGSVVD